MHEKVRWGDREAEGEKQLLAFSYYNFSKQSKVSS
jgi:hypothetical protein